jgi:hypothetical protein
VEHVIAVLLVLVLVLDPASKEDSKHTAIFIITAAAVPSSNPLLHSC